MFQNDRAFGLGIEGQDGVSPKFPHAGAEIAAGSSRQQVAVEGFTRKGSRDRAVRADQPEIEAKLLHNRQGKSVAPARNHYYFDPFGMGAAKAAISTGEIWNSGFSRVPSISRASRRIGGVTEKILASGIGLGHHRSRGDSRPRLSWRSEAPQFTVPATPRTRPFRGRCQTAYYTAALRMGSLLFFAFSWWGILLQAFAIIHFIRRRPDTFWLWIILIGGWLGALVYIAVEAVPDAGLLRQTFKVFPRRKRIRELESAILDNPSAGNYEELADLYLEEGQVRASAAGLRQINFVSYRLA